MRLWFFILVLFLFFLVGIGFAIIVVEALPLIQDKVHEKRSAYLSSVSHEVGTWFHLKLETSDLFAAFNPINISVRTGACDPDIRVIQLHFEGARSSFMGDYNFSDPEQFEEYLNQSHREIVHLQRESLTTFAGSIQDVTYTTGGEFNIGITITREDGGVEGYGMGNTNFALKQIMKISRPEALIQLRNSRVTTGLTYATVGLALLAVGLVGLIDLMIRFVVT